MAKDLDKKILGKQWTDFLTVGYNSEKCEEEIFRKRLRCFLSGLSIREHWRYMGVFERVPETGRLHFHALLFVPDGGDCELFRQCLIEYIGLNTIDKVDLKQLNYIVKYFKRASKNEKIIYSRN